MSILRPLYHVRLAIYRQTPVFSQGGLRTTWRKVNKILDSTLGVPGEIMCHIDFTYIRRGKDVPPAVESGKPELRQGVMFFDQACNIIEPGDTLVAISGPITGKFNTRVLADEIPDVITGDLDHCEVQVFELPSSLTLEGVYPQAQAGD